MNLDELSKRPQVVKAQHNAAILDDILEDFATGEIRVHDVEPILASRPLPKLLDTLEATALKPSSKGSVSRLLHMLTR